MHENNTFTLQIIHMNSDTEHKPS